jgi:hypothetical protein
MALAGDRWSDQFLINPWREFEVYKYPTRRTISSKERNNTMSDYTLYFEFLMLKRLTRFDLPEDARQAAKACKLTWTGCFGRELSELKNSAGSGKNIRWQYRNTMVDYITFWRNQLVHSEYINQASHRISTLGNPLDVILWALQQSNDNEVMPAIIAIQKLKPMAPVMEEGLQPLQEFLWPKNQ